MFNITAGNDISFRISLYRGGDAFPVELSHDVVVNVVSSKTRRAVPFSIGEGVVYVDVSHEGLGTGIYGIEVRGVLNGGTWRSYYDSVWQYTLATRAGEGYSDSEGDVYDITMDVQFYNSGDVDAKIEAHNQSEEAHPYIRGLISQKQDVIPDLATIRSGAEKGATSYQKPAGGIPYYDLDDDVNNDLVMGNEAWADLHDEDNGLLWKVPAQASKTNKLADKDFVNSSIETSTATFRGTYNLVSQLGLSVNATQAQIAAALNTTVSVKDNNDYVFVQIPTSDTTPTEISRVDRYKYNGSTFAFEWSLNNSSFTAAQWAAISSGITSGDVDKLRALPTKAQLDTLFGEINDTLQDHANAIEEKADKTNVVHIVFPASDKQLITSMLQPNEIAEVDYEDYMDFGFDGVTNSQKCEYCIKFDVGSTIPRVGITGVEWSEALTLEQNKHYVLLINYENGAMYGDWKAYNIASV